MEVLALVVLCVVLAWWLGFFRSIKRLAHMANRSVASLEIEQSSSLKEKYSDVNIGELKEFTAKFDVN